MQISKDLYCEREIKKQELRNQNVDISLNDKVEQNVRGTDVNINQEILPQKLSKAVHLVSLSTGGSSNSSYVENNSNTAVMLHSTKLSECMAADKSQIKVAEVVEEHNKAGKTKTYLESDKSLSDDRSSKVSSKHFSKIEVTADNTTLIDFAYVAKKIKVNPNPNQAVQMLNESEIDEYQNAKQNFVYDVGSFYLQKREQDFCEYDKIFEKDRQYVNYLKECVRKNFSTINNVCRINFTTAPKIKEKSRSVIFYSTCIYTETCRRYKFVVAFATKPPRVDVFSDKNEMRHPQNELKIQQVRGLRRKLVKEEIKDTLPSMYRNKQLLQLPNALRDVGNLGELISNDVCRKIRSEAIHRFDRHEDHCTDVRLMQKTKQWSAFIQRNGTPQHTYLYSSEQLMLTMRNNGLLLNMSRNSLFF